MGLFFQQVDVFSQKPCRGNPVAVVYDDECSLGKSTMQSIASWMNLSETVFVQPSKSADYKLRIFTPRNELTFAGHPTIGAGFSIVSRGLVNRPDFTQECKAGIIQLSRNPEGIIMARVPEIVLENATFKSEEISDAIGESVKDVKALNAGPLWITGRVLSKEKLMAINPDFAKISDISRRTGATGITLYSINSHKSVSVRSFAPASGINEDPVCGSGNACVAHHLVLTGASVQSRYTGQQGEALGRKGEVNVNRVDGKIWIGGKSNICIEGEIPI